MKKPHFLCVAPYEGMREIFINLAALRSDVVCTVLMGDQIDGVKAASEHIGQNIDGIISRGETAALLSNAFSIPTFTITFSTYDILRAIKSAQSISDHFAIIGKSDITRSAQLLCNLLQYHDIGIETFSDIAETESIVRRCKKAGYSLIVGDINTVNHAKRLNMQHILIISGPESIEETLDRAIRFTESIRKIHEQELLLKEILLQLPCQLALFDSNEKIIHSTLDDEAYSLLPVMHMNISGVLSDGKVEVIQKSDTACYTVCGQALLINQQQYGLFYIVKDTKLLMAKSIATYNKSDFNDLDYNISWGHGEKITRFINAAEQYAKSPYPILILSEYGSEEDHLAVHIYRNSQLNNFPMIKVDCSMMPKSDWASFFDSYSSPLYSKRSLLYIKGLEALPSEWLNKLFLYMDSSDIYKRNKVLLSFQYAFSQNSDKFYRQYAHFLASYVILKIPPLRDHAEDIWEVSNLYINGLNLEYGKQSVGLQVDAAEQLVKFPWPHNILQLKQVLKTAVISSESPYISKRDMETIISNIVFTSNLTGIINSTNIDYSLSLREIERQIVDYVLRVENMNQSRTAKRLNISRSTLWRMLNE
jgi:transcriptional regulator with PAS, ATPase and Fis domain